MSTKPFAHLPVLATTVYHLLLSSVCLSAFQVREGGQVDEAMRAFVPGYTEQCVSEAVIIGLENTVLAFVLLLAGLAATAAVFVAELVAKRAGIKGRLIRDMN